MRIAVIVAIMSLTSTGALAQSASKAPASKPLHLAAMCFHKGEQTSGMNKICYYNCLGSTVAINVKNYELCPLTIEN